MQRVSLFRTARKGFTLLELVITTGILIFALCGILATYIACLELSETTKNSNLALNSASRVLEEIRSAPFLSIFSSYNGYTFQVSGMPGNSSLGRVVIDDTDPALLNVNIGVCWRQKASKVIGECQLSGETVIFSDANGNGILDSPVQLTTRMSQR